MGDRIGVVFQSEYYEDSPVLHSHWMGRELTKAVQLWMKTVDTSDMVPGEAMVKFIAWYAIEYGIPSELDIQTHEDDCEDNGIFYADLDNGTVC